jgi:hypothetical protein
MSLRSNIDHLAIAQGIDGVAVESPLGDREHRGPESWRPILDRALNLLAMTSEPTIRLVIGKHTVVVQKEGDETVAVVLPTGHAIAKSLRRMIRRMAKKDRGPLPAPQPPAHPSSVSAPGIARPGTSSPTFPWDVGG